MAMGTYKPIGSCESPAWEDEQRQRYTCAGCGAPKGLGCLVCWPCFKGTNGMPAFKYWQEGWEKWLATCWKLRGV